MVILFKTLRNITPVVGLLCPPRAAGGALLPGAGIAVFRLGRSEALTFLLGTADIVVFRLVPTDVFEPIDKSTDGLLLSLSDFFS